MCCPGENDEAPLEPASATADEAARRTVAPMTVTMFFFILVSTWRVTRHRTPAPETQQAPRPSGGGTQRLHGGAMTRWGLFCARRSAYPFPPAGNLTRPWWS